MWPILEYCHMGISATYGHMRFYMYHIKTSEQNSHMAFTANIEILSYDIVDDFDHGLPVLIVCVLFQQL